MIADEYTYDEEGEEERDAALTAHFHHFAVACINQLPDNPLDKERRALFLVSLRLLHDAYDAMHAVVV